MENPQYPIRYERPKATPTDQKSHARKAMVRRTLSLGAWALLALSAIAAHKGEEQPVGTQKAPVYNPAK